MVIYIVGVGALKKEGAKLNNYYGFGHKHRASFFGSLESVLYGLLLRSGLFTNCASDFVMALFHGSLNWKEPNINLSPGKVHDDVTMYVNGYKPCTYSSHSTPGSLMSPISNRVGCGLPEKSL